MSSSVVAMSVATPVRGRSLSSTDMSNDSPLPTPPQAMHDLLRNGKVSASHSGRSSLQGGRGRGGGGEGGSELEEVIQKHRQSSSPSTRAAAAAASGGGVGRSVLRSSGLNTSPSSPLTVSMGASSHHNHYRSALGSQMGILHNSTNQTSEAASAETSLKPSRPGALISSSQRSVSYQDSGTPKRAADEGGRLSTRSSIMSLTASAPDSASHQGSNKENLIDVRLSALSSRSQRRTSAMRRLSDKRSPSPTATTADAVLHSSDNGTTSSNYRRSLAEIDQRQGSSGLSSSRIRTKASSEDVGLSSRRSLNRSPREDSFPAAEFAAKQVDESMGLPSVSQYVTPGLTGAARVMRSGHAPKHAAAPWSVGRSIKRIDRHYGPDKPPQRIVASQEEEEEEEEEGEDEEDELQQKHSRIDLREGREVEARLRYRDMNRGRLEVQEEDKELDEILNVKANEEAFTEERKSLRNWHGSGSENSNRSPMIQVPLGADEDEEEDDFILHDHHRLKRSDHYSSFSSSAPARRSTSAREVEPASRRAVMQDILSAKIPLVTVNKRVLGETSGHASGSNMGLPSVVGVREAIGSNVAFGSEKDVVKIDFMAQVRQEAARQVGQEHLERLGNKPSKDLETKFNGYKFKKIRKAGEGGFSTVWQVRGPFAAPDPLHPGQYIDVPESEQAYFAMKQVTLKKMEKISREEVLEECNLLQSLAGKKNNEDFILRFFGWKSSTGSLKILLELGEHDFNHILREGRLSRQQIMQYWHQMLEAVHFTHEEGNIVHTDLKPANFLMANGRLKLIDFGIAQKIPVGTIHIKRDAMIGTPNYMAPETVKAVKEARKESRDARVYKAGKASDVWALGCIFYQMVYYRPPFEAFHGDEKLKEILDPKHVIQYPTHRPAPPYPDDDDNEVKEDLEEQEVMEEVVEDMINVMHLTFIYDPQERVTIPQLLHHPFLQTLYNNASRNRKNKREETITMSRATLKEILCKIYAFTRSGELQEDDLDERGDMLFDNIRDKQHQIAAP